MLTGAAALVTALVGAATVWQATDGGNGAGTSARPATTAIKETPRDVTDAPTTTSGTFGESAGAVVRTGEVTLGDNESVELADGRVSTGVVGDIYLNGAAIPENATIHSLYGIAKADRAPDRARCVELLTARRDGSISAADAGSWLCVNTDNGTIAALHVVAKPAIGSPRLVFEYTLWS